MLLTPHPAKGTQSYKTISLRETQKEKSLHARSSPAARVWGISFFDWKSRYGVVAYAYAYVYVLCVCVMCVRDRKKGESCELLHSLTRAADIAIGGCTYRMYDTCSLCLSICFASMAADACRTSMRGRLAGCVCMYVGR